MPPTQHQNIRQSRRSRWTGFLKLQHLRCRFDCLNQLLSKKFQSIELLSNLHYPRRCCQSQWRWNRCSLRLRLSQFPRTNPSSYSLQLHRALSTRLQWHWRQKHQGPLRRRSQLRPSRSIRLNPLLGATLSRRPYFRLRCRLLYSRWSRPQWKPNSHPQHSMWNPPQRRSSPRHARNNPKQWSSGPTHSHTVPRRQPDLRMQRCRALLPVNSLRRHACFVPTPCCLHHWLENPCRMRNHRLLKSCRCLQRSKKWLAHSPLAPALSNVFPLLSRRRQLQCC